jgi:hypothetical protein
MIPRLRPPTERATAADEPPKAEARSRVDARLRDGLPYCLAIFLGVRLGVALLALVGVALLPDLSGVGDLARRGLVPHPVNVPGWPAHVITPGWHNLFTSLEREDALWFLRIATGGYRTTDSSAAFFPLYPIAIRIVSVMLGGHPLAAALIVSNAAFLGALVVLYDLTRSELSEETARRAVLYAAVFPTALFWFAPYSESLFFLLVLLCLWAARRGRWEVAGVAGALGALTRNIGVFLTLPMAIEAIRHAGAGERLRRISLRGLAWSMAPVGGLALFLAYWARRGGALAPLNQQANWDRHLTNPLLTLGKGTNLAFRYVGAYPGGYHLLDWLIAVPILAAGIYAVVRFRPPYGAWAIVGVLVPLASIFEGRPLIAFSRYALPVFPVYWAFARWTARSRAAHEVLVAVSAATLGIMTLLFVTWYYVI